MTPTAKRSIDRGTLTQTMEGETELAVPRPSVADFQLVQNRTVWGVCGAATIPAAKRVQDTQMRIRPRSLNEVIARDPNTTRGIQ